MNDDNTSHKIASTMRRAAEVHERRMERSKGNWTSCGPTSMMAMSLMENLFPDLSIRFALMPCEVVTFRKDSPQARACFFAVHDAINEVIQEKQAEGIRSEELQWIGQEGMRALAPFPSFCGRLFQPHGMGGDIRKGTLTEDTVDEWLGKQCDPASPDAPIIESLAKKILQKVREGKIDPTYWGDFAKQYGHYMAIAKVKGADKDVMVDFTAKQFGKQYPLVAQELDFSYAERGEVGTRAFISSGNLAYITPASAKFRSSYLGGLSGDAAELIAEAGLSAYGRKTQTEQTGRGFGNRTNPLSPPSSNWAGD